MCGGRMEHPSPLQEVHPGRGSNHRNVPFLMPGVKKEVQGKGRAWQSFAKWGRGREGPAEAQRNLQQGEAVAAGVEGP